MTMQEYVTKIAFVMGLPTNHNVESQQIEMAVTIAFDEVKRYIRTPVEKTVPFRHRLDLVALDIKTNRVLNVLAARPRVGLLTGSYNGGSIFEMAAMASMQGNYMGRGALNIEPIMYQLANAQVRNTLSTDFQWRYDTINQVIYCTHQAPLPATVTVRYVPEFVDVAEIPSPTWQDFILRMATAYYKLSLGRSRSKYRVEGSNVTLDGEALVAEANNELDTMRQELESKRSKLVVVN